MKTTSTREEAERIAKMYTREGTGYADRLYQLAYAIDRALQAERERAAKIAETPYGDEVQAFAGDEPNTVGRKIAAAIRSNDAK